MMILLLDTQKISCKVLHGKIFIVPVLLNINIAPNGLNLKIYGIWQVALDAHDDRFACFT